jgi:hypothetical protein
VRLGSGFVSVEIACGCTISYVRYCMGVLFVGHVLDTIYGERWRDERRGHTIAYY